MTIDWGFAGRVGMLGFGVVFSVLVILALVVWILGLVARGVSVGTKKIEAREEKISKWR